MDKFVIKLSVPQDKKCTTSKQVESTIQSETDVQSLCKGSSGRKFQSKWRAIFPWIYFDEARDKVFCQVCKGAVDGKLLPHGLIIKESNNPFTYNGFSQWRKAIERFKIHEKSSLHRAAVLATMSNKKGENVSSMLSKSKLEEMKTARKALITIISSIKYLSQQGLALRGHTDESSNIKQLLLLRSEDVPELKSWLQRTTYKWLSHEIINEIISLLATDALSQMLSSLKEANFYALIIDETMDISIKEQMSICFRFVDKKLNIEEIFTGFYETDSTTSASLLKIVLDVLTRFNLDIQNCRGQCYDGASNVSGHITGLQKRITDLEKKAIYVHCNAHNLNLVVQDAMNNIYCVRDFLVILREVISFVRHSPKRLAVFKSLQNDDNSESDVSEKQSIPGLRPFCPTRWCVRIKSLKALENNYEILLMFLEELSMEKNETGGKASGFLANMQSFKFFFLLISLINIFSKIENVNSVIQSKTLIYSDAKHLIENLIQTLLSQRDKFEELWCETLDKSKKNNIEDPILPRPRKIPKRFNDGCNSHVFETPKELFRQIFFEIIDRATNSLKNRFNTDTMTFVSQIERFCLTKVDADEIIKFYDSDFNKEKLILHRDMFLDICESKNFKMSNIQDIVNILKKENSLCDLLSEFVKFIRIFLTIPVTSCTSERSFSALRRLKTFLRSTMTQKRLNNLAILHIYKDCTVVDENKIANTFINSTDIRRKTFWIENSN